MTEDELRQSDMDGESVRGVVNARELREVLPSTQAGLCLTCLTF
ncbi:MAG: hypothetical protein AB1Z29_19465 [Desulfobacterales bacterium]